MSELTDPWDNTTTRKVVVFAVIFSLLGVGAFFAMTRETEQPGSEYLVGRFVPVPGTPDLALDTSTGKVCRTYNLSGSLLDVPRCEDLIEKSGPKAEK